MNGPAVVKCVVCGQDCMTWLPDGLPVCEPCDIEIEGDAKMPPARPGGDPGRAGGA